jgi:hypothetical protein
MFKTQIFEAPRSNYLLNFFTFNGLYVTLTTVSLWKLGELAERYILKEGDQKGYILPVFRVLED